MTEKQKKLVENYIRNEVKKRLNEENYYDSDEFNKFQNNFTRFTVELAKLSKKYGIAIDATGGVSYGDIKSIKYSRDLSSGDLHSYVEWLND